MRTSCDPHDTHGTHLYPDDTFLQARIENLSPEVCDLANGLMHPDPEQGLNVRQALQSPLSQNPNVGSDESQQKLMALSQE